MPTTVAEKVVKNIAIHDFAKPCASECTRRGPDNCPHCRACNCCNGLCLNGCILCRGDGKVSPGLYSGGRTSKCRPCSGHASNS